MMRLDITRTAMNAKLSVFVICVEAIIYRISSNKRRASTSAAL